MTPLERSRFAANVAMASEAAPRSGLLGAIDSARLALDTARQNIIAHHGWTTGVGDCLLDVTSCCAVVWCFPTVLAQFAERLLSQRRFTCVLVGLVLWLGLAATFAFAYYRPACALEPCPIPCMNTPSCDECAETSVASAGPATRLVFDEESQTLRLAPVALKVTVTKASLAQCRTVEAYYDFSPLYTGLLAASVGFSLVAVALTLIVRRSIRARDDIPPTVMQGLDDCLCAALCGSCVLAQMMRHEGLTHGKYHLLSSNGRDEALMV